MAKEDVSAAVDMALDLKETRHVLREWIREGEQLAVIENRWKERGSGQDGKF